MSKLDKVEKWAAARKREMEIRNNIGGEDYERFTDLLWVISILRKHYNLFRG